MSKNNHGEEDVVQGIITNGALPYCAKDEKTFLEALKKSSECTYGNDKLFVNYDGKENVFVQFSSLIERIINESNNFTDKGRVILMQHGLDGFNGATDTNKARAQYDEFEKMVIALKEKTAKNGLPYKSLGIITKRGTTIKKLKEKKITYREKDGTYLFFNDATDCEKTESYEKNNKNGVSELIEEIARTHNILIRTELSTGQESFETQLKELQEIVDILGHFSSSINVTYIGHSMGGLASINYGITYGAYNYLKNIDIITISTPYRANSFAKLKSKTKILQTSASDDLASEYRRLELIEKWKGRNLNTELCAIAVTKAGLEDDERAIELGDGIVELQSQLGGDFPDVSPQYIVVYNKNETPGPDSIALWNDAYHSNTPDMKEVIDIVNDSIRGLAGRKV